jgi:putative peptide zinc metalloprotease protein
VLSHPGLREEQQRVDIHLTHDDDEELVQIPRRRRSGDPGRVRAAGVPETATAPEELEAPAVPAPPVRDEFSDDRLVRPAGSGTAQQGWRRLLRDATGGAVALPPSRTEIAQTALLARVRAPVDGCRRIAVLSRKGGVGKTSVTLGLGHTFATLRPDRVVALDANPDAGTLGYRVATDARARHDRTLTDLLRDADSITRYSDVRRYTTQAPSRLEVMASDDDPRITRAVGELEYEAAVEVLERHYNLLLTDTGTDITHSVMQGTLAAADQIVVVAGPSLDGARAASKTFDWLEQNGHGYLVRGAVVVVNGVRRRSLVDLEPIVAHFGGRCRAVLPIPWDRHLEAGAQTSLDDLAPNTRAAYVELAAAIADGFGPFAR